MLVPFRRRTLFAAAAALGAGLWVREGKGQSVEVPLRLQAELLARVAAYDRSFAPRARGHVLVLIAMKPGNAESERVAQQMEAELRVLTQIGGLPHTEEIMRYSSASALAELCKSRLPAIVYVSLGLGDQMESIANALDGISVLSVSATASYVARRAVLGFDAESGKPKLVVHLGQARRQRVAFKSGLLAIARVIQ